MKPIGGEIMQHVPDLAAILMALKTHVATEAGFEPLDSIPGCAEEIVGHRYGNHAQSFSRTQSKASRVQIQMSRR